MKKVTIILLFVLTLSSCDAIKEYFSSSKSKENEDSKKSDSSLDVEDTLYLLGLDIGRSLQVFSLESDELELVLQGLKDYHTKDRKSLDERLGKDRNNIRTLATQRKAVADAENLSKGKEYFDKYSKKSDVKTTESGLAYKIIEPGSSEKPLPTSTVTVNYKGTLIDGTVFDSSYDRGKPATFALNRVIKGWGEGMQLIGKGGKIELVVPASLGYGVRGAGSIPGNSLLIFEVELLDIDNTPKPVAKPKPSPVKIVPSK
ncbi:MAG: FKBP-type peptidyl-prolyl cis-trans isomerase [Spirochaetes bacterium]|nr:FKBP-type peptidyl-prolyl cis-trans isomerase [Spirochaetota bacterium]MBN2772114.1 FKBP-type peptidyl-prolyl cis-trans isomerase [Spirochaetota bacterium]